MSCSLLTLKGKDWRDKRVKMTPIFSSGKIKLMFNLVDVIGERLVKALLSSVEQSEVQEMRSWSGRYTGDVIGIAAFGLECRCKQI